MNIKDKVIDFIEYEQVIEKPYTETDNPEASNAYTFIQASNFYKLFWIFIIGSIFGYFMEMTQYYILKGILESRAGVIWGPFSEIYGCGMVLLYLLSQLLKNTSPLTKFCVSTICGSSFEYLARLFQEVFFGSISWDYSKSFLNIGGRTSLKYGMCWGMLGLVFINWIFPRVSKLLEKMKGKLSFAFTWFLIIFMTANLFCSSIAVIRWSDRMQGIKPQGAVEEFFDSHYGNEKMKDIFPHLRFVDTTK